MLKRKQHKSKVLKNQLKVEEKSVKKKNKKKRKKEKTFSSKNIGFGKALQSVLDGSILTKEIVIGLLPFVLFVTLIAIVYIANTYYAEKTVIKIERVSKDLKELRYEHITIKSELMFYTKQSEIGKKLKPKGIKESLEPPKKIFINNKK